MNTRVLVCIVTSIMCLNTSAQTIRPRSSSALNTGKWYKIAVPKTGVYALDFNFLTKTMNIPAEELKIPTFGVFGYGGGVLSEENNASFYTDLPENSIEVVDNNNNGLIEDGDRILFYAEGPYRKRYNPITERFVHTSAFYSDVQHFFVSTTQGTQKKINLQNVSGSPAKIYTSYDQIAVRDLDSVNPKSSGRIWFSSIMSNFSRSITVPLPESNCTGGTDIHITFSYYTKIATQAVQISVNNQLVKTINPIGSNELIVDTIRMTCPGPNSKLNFSVTSPITDNFYLDYVVVNASSELRYQGQQFSFRFKQLGSDFYQAQIATPASGLRVWNVTDIENIRNVQLNGGGSSAGFVFTNQILNEFIAFDNQNTTPPLYIGKVDNQNLQETQPVDHIIVCNKSWISVAKQLADFHKEESGISTAVVDVDQIYNEYSSGNKDVTAIRRFIRQQFARSTPSESLRTILLFGKACVDYKSIEGNRCQDFVPTYETTVPDDFLESFCTDDYFALLEGAESNLSAPQKTLDVGIGRIPVASLAEAKDALAKIKAYKSKESYHDWRNLTTFVSDDYDDRVDGDFYKQNEETLYKFVSTNSIKTNTSKVYLDAFRQEQFSGGQRYPDAEKLLKDNISYGSLLITYIGHGGSTNWAQERLLSVSDLPIYKNLASLPFMTTATCGFAPFDKPSADKSAGEMFILQKDGGAIALLTTCREVLISDQGPFMGRFIRNFYNRQTSGQFRTFGEIARATKNESNTDLNSQKVVLLGDPALIVNMPQYDIRTTSISNGTDDTLRSLSRMTISGEVRDLSGQRMSDFNGYCEITLFDKKTENRLNYNDETDPRLPKDTFQTQESRIFRGSATVVNGQFTIQFVVPKDINYAMGRGRISYYAADVNTKPYRDASGIDTNVWIGGANLNAPADNKPPVVQLFMNDEKFVFGGITNADPFLFAKISDESGINTTGAGIGHDITGIIDDQVRIPIILNNYYRTLTGDFTQGRVNYPFYQLSEGKHTLKVKAWDVYNNPGEGYTEFIVAKTAGIALRHVLNYPNPFTTNTQFQFEHNRPNQPLDVTIQVMTVTGRVVKRFYKQIQTPGFRVDSQFPWDGRDDMGDRIGRGVYIYVVTIRDTKGESAYQYEKLVLLQ